MFNRDKGAKLCPLLKKPCIEHECAWYMQVRGSHPQTGQPVDEYGCAQVWQPILTIENSQQQRQTAAAVESFRNEMVKGNDKTAALLLSATRMTEAPANKDVLAHWDD